MTQERRPLQLRLTDSAEIRGRVGWAVPPGYGKTLAAMDAVAWSLADRVLWVGPKNVVQIAFPAEVRKWGVLDPADVYTLQSSDFGRHVAKGKDGEYVLAYDDKRATKKRIVALAQQYRVIAVSYDWIHPLAQVLGASRVFDFVVLDEAHAIKSRSAQRFKAANHLAAGAQHVLCMTGTPQTARWEEMWALAFAIDHGERLGRTVTEFRNTYLMPDRNGFTYSIRSDAHAEVVRALFAQIWIGPHKDELLQMPAVNMIDHMVAIPDVSHAAALRLMRGKLATLPNGAVDLPASVAAGLNGSLQICDGFRYQMELGTRAVVPAHNAKVEAVTDLLDEGLPGQVLLWYRYQENRDALARALGGRVIWDDEKDSVARWRAGEKQVLGSHPASLGEGQNFQDVGNNMIFFGLPWSLTHWVQGIARMARPGQTNPVFVHRVMADHPVELAVLDSLENKATLLQALLTRCGERNEQVERAS